MRLDTTVPADHHTASAATRIEGSDGLAVSRDALVEGVSMGVGLWTLHDAGVSRVGFVSAVIRSYICYRCVRWTLQQV